MAPQDWASRAKDFEVKDRKALDAPFAELDAFLTLRTYLSGYQAGDADKAVWQAIKSNHIAGSFIKQGTLINLTRWYKYVEETSTDLIAVLPSRPAKEISDAAAAEKEKEDAGGFAIELQPVDVPVVTRFPPEPS